MYMCTCILCVSHMTQPCKHPKFIFGGYISYSFLVKDFIYLFLERGEGREKERKRNISVWLPLAHPQLGTWRATQACALTGDQTGDPSVSRSVLNPLSQPSQGVFHILNGDKATEHFKGPLTEQLTKAAAVITTSHRSRVILSPCLPPPCLPSDGPESWGMDS